MPRMLFIPNLKSIHSQKTRINYIIFVSNYFKTHFELFYLRHFLISTMNIDYSTKSLYRVYYRHKLYNHFTILLSVSVDQIAHKNIILETDSGNVDGEVLPSFHDVEH